MKLPILLVSACLVPLVWAQAPPNPKLLKKMTPWVDPDTDAPAGTQYKIFHSNLANTDWSYLVYLPPDYETAPQKHYPAIYWLHGGGGTQRGGAAIVQRLDSAIRRGKAPAAIVFLLNGLGESCWSDSKDGSQPVESMIVQELVPYFDRTYRTIPRREARAIEGHSMGGMGTLHLVARHSDVFGAASGLAAALISEKDEPRKVPPVAFERVYGSDPAYFHENTVWTDTERNASKLRSGTLIRIVVGDKDAWVYQRLQDYHALLDRLQIPHEFIVVPGAQHPAVPLYDWLGDRAFDFYNKAFGSLALAAQPNPEEFARRKAEYIKDHPPRQSVGLIPLTDLGKGLYKGEQGGLYPGGENVPPAAHLEAGVRIARTVVPLDSEGKKSQDGKIVLLSIGFSNPNLKFQAFKPVAEAYAGRNPSLVVINGCVGSQAAQTIADPNANYWKIVDRRIKDAGVTNNQVEAIWMEQVIPGNSGDFPDLAKKLQGYIEDSLHNAMDRFPNLKLAYLSSRSYGGYTETGGSPEPLAYETGFAVKWAIADQIAGKPELNYDRAKGKVVAPWIAWGPYFWADGAKGRKDGLVLLRSDYQEKDGLHPSEAGLKKFVKLLMDFFETDAAARPWFLKQ